MTSETVHVAVFDTLADWEIGILTAHVRKPDWQQQPGRYDIVTVGVTDEPVTTMGGLRIVPDITLGDLDPARSAMLVLAGGDRWLSGELDGFVGAARAFLAAGVPVAAVCGATGALARAGVLDARPHTSNAPQYLESVGGYGGATHYVDTPAVVDGDLVTASGVRPVEFARAVFERLDLYRPDVLASWYKLYGEHDPAGFFELMAA